MNQVKSPSFFLFLYIFFSLFLWLCQDGINYQIGYGFFVLILAYCYFFLGVYLGKKKRVSEYTTYKRKINIRSLLVFLLFIDVLIVINLLFSFWGIINQGGSLLQYRTSIFLGDTIKVYYGDFAAYLFIYATIIPLLGISFGLYEKITHNRSKLLMISFVLLFCKEGVLFSRYYIFSAVLSAILMLYCYDIKMTLKKVMTVSLLFISAMVAAFALRGADGFLNNIGNALNYLIAGYSLFTNALDSNDISLLGQLSSPLSLLGVVGAKLYDSTPFFDKIQQFVYLGNAGFFNAFYTALLIPYLFTGAIGLMLISLLFGYLISLNDKKFKVKGGFISFNLLFSYFLLFFSHQFLPVQLSFFWEYTILSLLIYFLMSALNMEIK
ncbi:MAG: oligosaccharide repeat unit polymerase [Ewingella americana]|jgi:oligosaccharide repeat unit polymerase|uniref:O-antigen polymerase n=1 Tax=Ewingella americana TaxID=41202 RepID=UPI00242FB30A|nr:O-antigen polymerase [Ewingella americana]MCI1678773.1 oligosaccharide repeat unit polymerase [Ewingella americana]MCI1854360.1 oligosaccharide repeat unit polymerase [Ewingella americana]MCI1861660.1 oligosaccharide repeat unit polymerase [Ewingella americana]MCI2141006.1 oligosaccharide repeat unit polymerase [Ewingella americana]MCI2164124.1 oligosaccharide repeat unit polymerase [Ewingella americana]